MCRAWTVYYLRKCAVYMYVRERLCIHVCAHMLKVHLDIETWKHAVDQTTKYVHMNVTVHQSLIVNIYIIYYIYVYI